MAYTDQKLKMFRVMSLWSFVRRRIIVGYFCKMMSYKEGAARMGTDIEFVHEMRVTSRRLRAAMDNFADCFPEKSIQETPKKDKRR